MGVVNMYSKVLPKTSILNEIQKISIIESGQFEDEWSLIDNDYINLLGVLCRTKKIQKLLDVNIIKRKKKKKYIYIYIHEERNRKILDIRKNNKIREGIKEWQRERERERGQEEKRIWQSEIEGWNERKS